MTIMSNIDLDIRILKTLENERKIKYLRELREKCEEMKIKPTPINAIAKSVVRGIYPPIVRRYEYEYIGESLIPENKNVIFVCNHSNSHDFFTSLEGLGKKGINSTVFVASDDINVATQKLFEACNATLADRRDKTSTNEGLFAFCSKLVKNDTISGVMHSEATWNLHPFKLMHDMKYGAIVAALITGCPIIPTIYEYVEVGEPVSKESKLYKKCVIAFAYPYYANINRSLESQIQEIKTIMTNLRARVKHQYGTFKSSLRDVDPEVYLNSTFLKKYDGFGFTYDSNSEAKFLYSKDGRPVENEYRLNEHNILVPGVMSKEEGMRFLPRKKY